MYNVVIVEDDGIVRKYLRGVIDWNQYELNIAAEARNGKEAIDIIEQNEVHIVITDISMPVVDGIELIKYIQTNARSIKVIALSCYSEYDFIREALKCGAVDYILKQELVIDEFVALLEKTKELIHKEKAEKKTKEDINKIIKSNLLNNIFHNIVTTDDEILQSLEGRYRQLLEGDKYFIVVFKVDNYIQIQHELSPRELKNLSSDIMSIIEQYKECDGCSVAGMTHDNEYTVLFSYGVQKSIDAVIEELQGRISQICSRITSELSYTISAAVSKPCGNFSEISKIYKETRDVLEGMVLSFKNRIFFCSRRSDIVKAIDFIDSCYHDSISLVDVANHINISPNYFSILFKKEMGMGFSEYLLNIRLEKSKLWLKDCNVKVYEAAFKAGFNNNQYFNRVFKDKFGITPLAYRKQNLCSNK